MNNKRHFIQRIPNRHFPCLLLQHTNTPTSQQLNEKSKHMAHRFPLLQKATGTYLPRRGINVLIIDMP